VTDAAATGSSRARIPASRVDLEPAQRTVVADLSRAELSAFLGSEPVAASDAGQQPWNGAADVAGEPRSRTTDVRAREGSDVERLTRAEEELQIGKRQVQAGEVVVGKHVETERVSTPVQRRVEHVRVERRPVDDATGAAELREGEIRVPIMEEEVVVEKRPVVKEEVVVTREVATETQQVEADVRRERIDVSGDEELVDREDATRRQRAGGGNRG